MTLLALAMAATLGIPARAALPEAAFPTAASISELTIGLREGAARIGTMAQVQPAPPDPPASEFPIRGIDVSHYQDTIHWDKVKTAGLSFVYIKASDGDNISDAMFEANWKGATSAGLRKGAYHFYDFCKRGLAQAKLFVRTVPVEPDSLPPTIDLEASRECARLPKPPAFRKEFEAFVGALRAAYHKEPVLYVTYEIYDRYFAGSSQNLRIWISDFRSRPALSDMHQWLMWQYSYHGRVPGIDGPVDLDVFQGDAAQLAALGDPPAVLLAGR